jgi:hypothetical protein
MLKRFYISLSFLIVILHSGFGQDKKDPGLRILFQGMVMDANTLLPLANSQILINSAFSSVSGMNGAFSFYVFRKDTVVFKSLGYKSATLFVSDTLNGMEFNTGIFLNSDTLSIGEVIIVPRQRNLKSEILNGKSKVPSTMDNARYNVAVSAYAGRNSQSKLGTPDANYDVLRSKQKVDAYEKGGIPSDRIIGFSPLILIPAAYLLIKGPPENPSPMQRQLSDEELDQINKKYLENHRQKK